MLMHGDHNVLRIHHLTEVMKFLLKEVRMYPVWNKGLTMGKIRDEGRPTCESKSRSTASHWRSPVENFDQG